MSSEMKLNLYYLGVRCRWGGRLFIRSALELEGHKLIKSLMMALTADMFWAVSNYGSKMKIDECSLNAIRGKYMKLKIQILEAIGWLCCLANSEDFWVSLMLQRQFASACFRVNYDWGIWCWCLNISLLCENVWLFVKHSCKLYTLIHYLTRSFVLSSVLIIYISLSMSLFSPNLYSFIYFPPTSLTLCVILWCITDSSFSVNGSRAKLRLLTL